MAAQLMARKFTVTAAACLVNGQGEYFFTGAGFAG
jgi:hypothetical protein